jgi:hypothetical protein
MSNLRIPKIMEWRWSQQFVVFMLLPGNWHFSSWVAQRGAHGAQQETNGQGLSVLQHVGQHIATWDVETESNLQVISSDLEDLLGAWAIYQHGLSSDSSWSCTSPPRKALETAEGSAPTWVSWRLCRNMKSTANPEKTSEGSFTILRTAFCWCFLH